MADAWRAMVDTLSGPRFIETVVVVGLLALSVSLVVLMLTRWGQSKPLHKCVILSLAAHLLLVAYATTIHIVGAPPAMSDEPSIRIADVENVDDPSADSKLDRDPASPWEQFAATALPGPSVETPIHPQPEREAEPLPNVEQAPSDLADAAIGTPALAPGTTPPATVAPDAAIESLVQSAPPTPLDAPGPERRDADDATAAADVSTTEPQPLAQAELAPLSTPAPELPDTMPKGDANLAQIPELAPSLSPDALLATPLPSSPTDAHAPAPHDADMPLEVSTASISALPAARPLAPVPPRDGQARQSPRTSISGAQYVPPDLYKLRLEPQRARVVAGRGGSAATEAAVKSALDWLVRNQAADGRWIAANFGAGRESFTLDQDRGGAGADADSGITGLALLALLGAGHSHQHGEHQLAVARGLQYLASIQAADGNLAGNARTYSFMYCHGMATLALAEAFALTGDKSLEDALRRAIDYSLAAQNPITGGWRYRPRDSTGDTSQLGWQLLALKSGELGGLNIPMTTHEGMQRFLAAVSSGRYGGLASYRPREKATPTMTAEALVCRQFLAIDDRGAASREAGDYLLTDLPSSVRPNFYYWYYATIAMYQLQGEHWRRWNEALTPTLTKSQVAAGPQAGSWDPDPVWGGYGGRVYSTALGALCLEVYYRYLPLYAEAASREQTARTPANSPR